MQDCWGRSKGSFRSGLGGVWGVGFGGKRWYHFLENNWVCRVRVYHLEGTGSGSAEFRRRASSDSNIGLRVVEFMFRASALRDLGTTHYGFRA